MVRQTALALGAQLLAAPLQIAAVVLAARGLPAAQMGELQAAQNLLWILALVCQLGQVSAVVVQVRRQAAPPGRAIGLALGVALLAASLVGWGLYAAAPWVCARLLVGAPAAVVPILWVALLLLLATQVLGGLCRALDRFEDWAAASLLQHAGRVVALAVVLVVGATPSTAVVGTLAVAQLLPVLYLSWALRRTPPRWPGVAEENLAALRFGGAAWVAVVVGELHERGDLLLLSALRGDPVEVAAYAVALQVANRLRMIPLAVAAALLPELAGREPQVARALAAGASRVTSVGVLAMALFLALVAPWLLPWALGPGWTTAVGPTLLLLPATLAYSLHQVLERYFQARDRQLFNGVLQVIGLTLNVALNLAWVPSGGLVGAAAASLASYTLVAGIAAAAFVAEGGWSDARLLVPGLEDGRAAWAWVQRRWT